MLAGDYVGGLGKKAVGSLGLVMENNLLRIDFSQRLVYLCCASTVLPLALQEDAVAYTDLYAPSGKWNRY